MAELYRIEFSDLNKVEWRISIGDSAHTGTYTLLKATGNPLNFAYDNNSDDVFDPLRPSRATFEVYSETNFALLDLYSVEDMHYPVNIYCNDALYWTGYVETQNYAEAYEPPLYPVSITATDGLSILENILFADSIAYDAGEETITYYNGHDLESAIILDILAEIGHTEFKEYVNIYEDDMLSTVSDSPFDQIKIDTDVFKDYYCSEVLTEILKKYNAIIRQKNGVFCIVRPAELSDTTIYGRWFTAETTKTAITHNPDQFIKRTATHPSSRRIQIPGGRLMITPPAKKVTSVFEYGYKDSWLDNYELSSKYWDGADFQNWTRSSGTTIAPVGSYVAGMKEGVMMTTVNNLAGLPSMTGIDKYISQSFGSLAIISTYDQFYFEFDYLTYNFSGADISSYNFILVVKSDTGGYYLYNLTGDENFAYWQNSFAPWSFTVAAPNGNSSWTTIKRQISGLPVSGSYTVQLYGAGAGEDCYIAFKNIKFYVTSDEVIVKRRKHKGPFAKLARWILRTPEYTFKYIDNVEVVENEYNVFNSINGVNMGYDYRLGDVVDADMDNIIEQCAGALVVMARTDVYRVDTIILTGSTGACEVTVGGLSDTAIFFGDLSDTAADFVSNNVLAFDSIGITLTSAGSHLIFTSQVAGAEFDGDTSLQNISGNLFGTIEYTTASYSEALEPSDKWIYRGGSSYKPLLHHMTDEIAEIYSKPRQFIQMPLKEIGQGIQIDVIGNFQDDINTSGGETRVFVMNRAEFDVRNRKWEIDLHEIGTRAAESETEETLSIVYGYLYNWYAVDDAREITADGWHIPTDDEVIILSTYLDPATDPLIRGPVSLIAGEYLKEIGTVYWSAPNAYSSNTVKFNARGSGGRNQDGTFSFLKSYFFTWCSTLYSGYPVRFELFYSQAYLIRSSDYHKKGKALRPIKDSTTLTHGQTGTYIGNDGKVYRTICIGTQEWLADNLAETLYRDGTPIPEVTDNAEWAALETGARCSYDNDEDNALIMEVSSSTTADSTTVTADNGLITVDTI